LSTESLLNIRRRLTQVGTTAEFVAVDAAHWAIEPFVPINTIELIDALIGRWSDWSQDSAELSESRGDKRAAVMPDETAVRDLFSGFADLLHHEYRPLFSRFAQRYADLDPDRDTRLILPPRRSVDSGDPREISGVDDPAAAQQLLEDVGRITEVGKRILYDAGYTEIDRAELDRAVGVYSPWGVPLHVDFDVFDAIAVYARGDVVGKRTKRHWRNFYREELFEVSLYQRVVVMFKLRPGFRTEDQLDDKLLHLRMFKNIPKQDIDMLLPGTRVKFSWIDHLRNIVPSLGGIGLTLFKIARIGFFVAAITFSIAAVLIGLCVALVSYMIRSVMNHLNAKNRYMLNLTRSLYYQKLDSNAGVACRLLDEAETQRHRELIVAYYAMWSAGEPLSHRRLRRRGERMVRELVDVEIAFRSDDAIATLSTWGLIHTDSNGKLQTAAPEEALRRIGVYWNHLIRNGN